MSRARWRSERGQAALELLGGAPLLVLVSLALVQALLIGHTAVVTEQAARTAARVAMVTEDGARTRTSGVSALPPWLQSGANVRLSAGPSVSVTVSSRVPSVVPGVRLARLRIERTVAMPSLRSPWD